MNSLPETGFLRITQILGNKKTNPPIPALIPISTSTWLAGVKSGIFPSPIKLSQAVTVWRVEDIRSLIENGSRWNSKTATQKIKTNENVHK